MNQIMNRTPLYQMADPVDRAHVAKARQRVALKRWLRKNGCPMPCNTPTHILRTIAQRIKAGQILIVP
jgi:hypothetical protein